MSETTPARRLLPWLAYPCVVGASLALFALLTGAGVSDQLSGYAAAAAGAVLVTVCELTLPHLERWRGQLEDVRADAVYLVVVQMLLPVLLAFTLSLWLLRGLQGMGLEPSRLWPHAWPIALQAMLMLLAADFLRYWLHVACHRFEPLWRLHAVHHSPAKLYWLNVGRFHPVEKALQYLLDALPFVLLGVTEPVLGLYFVFYAVNGFFQHSNVELRFGLLNYVISSAELHRWHHSRVAAESNTNYGNNLIVWDLLFGTRFLPRDREIADLGLPNRSYPMRFLDQMKTPFVRGIEQAQTGLPSWQEIGANFLIRARMAWLQRTAWPALVRAAAHPRDTQLALLQSILAQNRDTHFGREHGFSDISSWEEYRARVPVQDYESLRPHIEEQDRTGAPVLTAEPPVLYAQTSGTTGEPKYIPILSRSLRGHRACQNLFFLVQFRTQRAAYDGRLLAIVSPPVEGHRDSGRPFGSASGHLYQNMPRIMRAKYVLPWQVFTVEDYDLKYLLILRLALAEKNITYMASANPSTFVRLMSLLDEHRLELLHDISGDAFSHSDALPPEVQQAIEPQLDCAPERREELAALLRRPSPSIADLWPHLKLLTTWTGGSCGIALDTVRAGLPPATRVAELGYLASEFLGSITVDLDAEGGLPTLQHNLFEFVAKDRWEREVPEFLTLDELEVGSEYYVFVTTQTGLYRYFMNDIVRTTGRFGATPTIQFVQKGKGVTNITGEKLYESQVIEAVTAAERELGIASRFFLVVADAEEARYRLLIEPESPIAAPSLASAVERRLGEMNLEYGQKRASGRLKPLEACALEPGTGEAYKKSCLERGQREGQFKIQVLQWRSELAFRYEEHVVPPA